MQRTKGNGLQDQHVKRALQQIELFVHRMTSPRTSRDIRDSPRLSRGGRRAKTYRRATDFGSPRLEAERHLQIDAPVGGVAPVRPAGDAVGLAEERRTQVADGRGHVRLIEDISRGNRKRQAVSAGGRALIKTAIPASSTTSASAAAHSRTAAKRATSARSAWASRGACFFCLAEAEGLAQARVKCEAPGA